MKVLIVAILLVICFFSPVLAAAETKENLSELEKAVEDTKKSANDAKKQGKGFIGLEQEGVTTKVGQGSNEKGLSSGETKGIDSEMKKLMEEEGIFNTE